MTTLLDIRELDSSDVSAILARNLVGRLAFVHNGEIDLRPIHYVYFDGSIYGRTSPGGKLDRVELNGVPVAFEVDEVHTMYSWRSVVVHGTLHVLAQNLDQEEWLRALGLIRRLMPHTLRGEDPAPHRTVLFRIVVGRATGRAVG